MSKDKPHIRFRYGRWECGIENSCYDFVPGLSPVTAYINWAFRYETGDFIARYVLKKHIDALNIH